MIVILLIMISSCMDCDTSPEEAYTTELFIRIGESLFVQVTKIELKESLGLRTASRTELLKSEKTSTAERYSVLR